jgi:hypothetical protein
MLQYFKVRNSVDDHGMPAGGTVEGLGLAIKWQDGPLGREPHERLNENGAFVETVIAAAKSRLEWYQTTNGARFACQENADAIAHLALALDALETRTAAREARAVEGTHAP